MGMGVQNRNLCFDKLICQNKELGSGGRQALAGPIAAVLLRARPSSSLVLEVRREIDPKELSQPAASCEAPSGPLGMLSWKKARPPNPSRCADRCRSHGVLISFLSHTAVQFLRGSAGKKHLRSD